ncbi:MAG: tRNA pseudouridine(38-40) synthase TruA [Opitutaceae bacterium]|jgi:tRNA pseudouridine38-40 synthase|nr:tRNA pseudouridine(38-40) synthase TruA [Opitutaceae bacterium]
MPDDSAPAATAAPASSSAFTPLRRWKCTVAYDGTGFSGWQSQPDGNAIQDHLERRLALILGAPVRIHGSGRTDAGVHARAQVFHFDAAWGHGREKLVAAFRAGSGADRLPEGIQVIDTQAAPPTFHARFSATGKRYTYEIFNGGFADPFTQAYCWSVPRELDRAAMQDATERLVGRHDFRAFSASGGEERESTVRDLRVLEVKERGRRRLRITAQADGFLYKMVRSLAGALVHAGLRKLSPDDIAALLAGGRRTRQIETAPPQGLFLDKVFYGQSGQSGQIGQAGPAED